MREVIYKVLAVKDPIIHNTSYEYRSATMPAKAKVTKEMIVDAAFAIAREAGVESINARTVSERLHCSTQPVMYHFATMEELKRTVYAKADLYHSEYLMTMKKPPKGAALGIGMNYIRFAIEEPNLFRFLFQSDYFSGKTLLELIDAEELLPVLTAMQSALGISMEQTRDEYFLWRKHMKMIDASGIGSFRITSDGGRI